MARAFVTMRLALAACRRHVFNSTCERRQVNGEDPRPGSTANAIGVFTRHWTDGQKLLESVYRLPQVGIIFV